MIRGLLSSQVSFNGGKGRPRVTTRETAEGEGSAGIFEDGGGPRAEGCGGLWKQNTDKERNPSPGLPEKERSPADTSISPARPTLDPDSRSTTK